MRRKRQLLKATMAALLLLLLVVGRNEFVVADQANDISLIISQLKITSSNGQFITLHNSSDAAVDMSKYQLQYFNSYDFTKATSSKTIPLSGTVPPHGYYMVNDSALMLCYQLTVNSVSLGLSSTAGLVELVSFNQSAPGTPLAPVLQDYIGWSKTAASGAQTLPANTNAFLQRQPVDGGNNPAVKSAGAGSWQTVQPDDTNPCQFKASNGQSLPVASGLGQLLPPSEPPATIASLAADGTDQAPTPTIPASDVGLKAPQVSEVLPNPIGTGNDDTDEFIELYNGNDKPFDLSGFILQTGLARTRKYTFPAGTTMAAGSHKAFYSESTTLSLSNTSGQVKLINPMGEAISFSDPYGTAKDGQTWSLAKGKWYWTTQPTADKANIIKQSAAKKKATAKSKTTKSSSGHAVAPAVGGPGEEPAIVPIHTRAIAIIIGLAILYGAYEYRVDAKNKLHQLRRHFGARRTNRRTAKRRRSD